MSAQALNFPAYLQIPLDAGVLSPHQAWRLAWDLEVLTLEPWTPGVQQVNQSVTLFHWQTEGLPVQ